MTGKLGMCKEIAKEFKSGNTLQNPQDMMDHKGLVIINEPNYAIQLSCPLRQHYFDISQIPRNL